MKQDAEALWAALKEECCVNPQRAHRIVMLEKEAFMRAFKAAFEKEESELTKEMKESCEQEAKHFMD